MKRLFLLIAICAISASWTSRLVAVQINEIRIDMPSSDINEYFELAGAPGESLDGLSYLVIGDSPTGGSGVIESRIDLSGHAIPDDGFFLVTEETYVQRDFWNEAPIPSGIEPDLISLMNFENSDNVVHLLVRGFDSDLHVDLDFSPEDGALDVNPWAEIVDAVGLVEMPDPTGPGNELIYGATLGFVDIGPDETFVPPHLYRQSDIHGPWMIGEFDPGNELAMDTPGVSNTGEIAPMGEYDFNSDGIYDVTDIDMLTRVGDLVVGIMSGFDMRFDLDADNQLDGEDLQIWLEQAAMENGFSAPYLLGDANLDGTVNAQDLNQVGINWQQTERVWSQGDFNGDGIVSVQDLNSLGINWQRSNGETPAPAAVPEPSCIALLLLGAITLRIAARRSATS